MRPYFNRKKLFLIPFAVAGFIALAGFVVMSLWNYLMPVIFHLGVITFWQALALFVLCKVLFGFGKGHHGGPAPWMRNRFADKMRNMSPEEREKFKEHLREKCGDGRWGGRHRHDYGFGDWDRPQTPPAPEKAAE